MSFYFVCPLCGNMDEKYVGYRKGKPYCRLCIGFRGEQAEYFEGKHKRVKIEMNYSLSPEQKRLSDRLLMNFKSRENSFVCAVCGSGKTEIVLETIKYAISVGYRCGFAVPRRDVAMELAQRFKKLLPKTQVASVYGGHTKKLYGDLIVLTTHQLFRYDHYFDLLILDEVDAFPFKGSVILNTLFERSIKLNYIMMSATPEITFLEDFGNRGGEVLMLNERFHKYPLPAPSLKTAPGFLLIFILYFELKRLLNVGKQVFIFTPTISLCESTYKILHFFIKNKGSFVHSKCPDRKEKIEKFRQGEYQYLFTTAVLERGVTIKDLQVIVYQADHKIYDRYSLVQISGRVGRKADAPTGEVIYIAKQDTAEIESSIKDIEASNKDLQNMFQRI